MARPTGMRCNADFCAATPVQPTKVGIESITDFYFYAFQNTSKYVHIFIFI